MPNKRFTIISSIVALILMIPLIAMQFTDEVNWGLFDFIVAGILLLSTGLMCDFVIRKVTTPKLKFAMVSAVILILLLIWAELAVGIFGTPFSGN